MKVLVTGADGFIGSHVAERLVRDGHDVRAFVLYNSFGHRGWLDQAPPGIRDGMEVVSGDIRDAEFMREAARGCEAVLHLAALIAIPYSYRAARSYVDTNITGTLNVLHAAMEAGASRIIHTSTSEVYGTAQQVPISEQHPLHAQSPYAATKIAADQLALSFHLSFGAPVMVLRPFNTYGPRQSARAVIPTIISQLLDGDGAIRLGAAHPTRDFNYIADTVEGFVAALGCDRAEAFGTVTNLGSGFEVSIGETARIITELMGKDLRIETDPARLRPEDSEVDRLFCDNARARDILGLEPGYAGLDGFRRGLRETIDWFSDPDNRARYRSGIYNV